MLSPGDLTECLRHRPGERTVAIADLADDTLGRIGGGNKLSPQIFGQRFDQCRHFFRDQPGHQPIEPLGIELCKALARHAERDAVALAFGS